MKNIKEFKNKYKDKDVIFYASGPSHLEYKKYTPDNVIKCGLNYTFENINDLDYLFIGEFETFNKIKDHFSNEKIIIPNITGLNHSGTSKRDKVIGDCIEYELQNPMLNKKIHLTNGDKTFNDNGKFISYTCTTQSAIHVLAYMGFKNIYLLGVDYKNYSNNKTHFKSKYDSNYSKQSWSVYNRFKEGDDIIFNKLEKYFDCKIINLGLK